MPSIVRYAASKVAVVVGLHEYADPVEDFLEYLYQDNDELLTQDATALNLRIVSKESELHQLLRKTGRAVETELRHVLQWSALRHQPAAVNDANQLIARVEKLVATAHKKRKLAADEATQTKKLLTEKIRQSVGVRNENLALRSYEQQTGNVVRLSNEKFYFVSFPMAPSDDLESVDYVALDSKARRWHVDKRDDPKDDCENEGDEEEDWFSICGMVDGVTDTIRITDDEEWELVPMVVEVKNRLRAFRNPPPLHDHLQMAVYMKMLDLDQGDLIQCLHNDRAAIHITRVKMDAYPLNATMQQPNNQLKPPQRNVWTTIVLPRLYQYTLVLAKYRENDLLRLAFLNGTLAERMEMLRRECDFLF